MRGVGQLEDLVAVALTPPTSSFNFLPILQQAETGGGAAARIWSR